MALEGQLSDFNLAEILQLIASQEKSGFLNLEAHRNMVFIFDKGVLVSTRDRRSNGRDPLESFLKAYGFFTQAQWKHIDFVRKNSSLDLTEILVSEGLLKEDQMVPILRSIAQEMTHQGMKLRRGRYHFSPTRGTPPGVRGGLRLDIQGLLMESARRLDEEQLLKDALPSQAITFTQGEKVLPPEALTNTGRRIMKLALAGLPLGRIIRQGQAESFVVRDLLKNWVEEGALVINNTGTDDGENSGKKGKGFKFKFDTGLRRLPVMLVLVLALGYAGYVRWLEPAPLAEGQGPELRQAQVRAEVIEAATLFRYNQGHWPEDLAVLVRGGQLDPSTLATVEGLGWKYTLNRRTDSFSLGA
jgi:hypothetical protein